ncbi:Glycosyltransferase_GTB-type domain containing protein [Candidatus Nanopelagicaceae bacterium]
MDRKDPLLSHQYEAVNSLAESFDNVLVITGKMGDVQPNSRVQILSTDWRPGDRFGNLRRFFWISLPIIARGNFSSVFFHMTDLQCSLLAPIIRMRGRRQYLWYAHTFKSRYLVFASWWVNKIITSTSGSCPISGSKVIPIGQAIDEDRFKALPFDNLNLSKLIHIGRFDKSKNIQLLISNARELKKNYSDIQLTLVGSPANLESRAWAQGLIRDTESDVHDGWLIFKESIPRELFRKEISDNGCFFHGYIGSLDKTLVESTMLRVPVVTINPEYISIFGNWGDTRDSTLVSEYIAMRALSRKDLEAELDRRLRIVVSEHTLKHWVFQLLSLLQ